jgi:hypothetical protein
VLGEALGQRVNSECLVVNATLCSPDARATQRLVSVAGLAQRPDARAASGATRVSDLG